MKIRKYGLTLGVMGIMLLSACGEISANEISEAAVAEAAAVSETNGAAAEEAKPADETTEAGSEEEFTEEIDGEIFGETFGETFPLPQLEIEEAAEGTENSDNPDKTGEDFFEEYDWEAQNAATDKFERLLNSFPVSEDNNPIYPDNFCGVYYESETACLYIALTDISENAVQPYRDITGDENVKFVQHKYPFNRLWELKEYVAGLMSDRERKIYSVGVRETDNCVDITAGSREALEALKDELIAKGFEEDSFEIVVGEMAVLC